MRTLYRVRAEEACVLSVASVSALLTSYAKPEGVVDWGDCDAEELRDRGEALMRAFLAAGVHADEKPMGVEVSVHAEIPGLALPVIGILDLVTAGRRVTDYKTVASTPDPALEAWLHEIQTTAYAMMVEHATDQPGAGTDLVFLAKTKTPKVIVHPVPPPTAVQRKRFAQLVEVYATGIANEHYYPSPGMQCSWCEYRSECQAWTGGAP